MSGDVEDRARVLLDRVRLRQVHPTHLAVAAWLGDEASAMVAEPWKPEPRTDYAKSEFYFAEQGETGRGPRDTWRTPTYLALRWAPLSLNVLRSFAVRMAEHAAAEWLPASAQPLVAELQKGQGSQALVDQTWDYMHAFYLQQAEERLAPEERLTAAADVLRDAAIVLTRGKDAKRTAAYGGMLEAAEGASSTSYSAQRAAANTLAHDWWTDVPPEEHAFQRGLLIGLLTGDVGPIPGRKRRRAAQARS